jgi:hypothetical protein
MRLSVADGHTEMPALTPKLEPRFSHTTTTASLDVVAYHPRARFIFERPMPFDIARFSHTATTASLDVVTYHPRARFTSGRPMPID